MPTFGHFTFEQRLEKIRSLVGYNNPIVGPVTYQLCLSRSQLIDYSKEIEKRGGPGVILRKPNSFYYDNNSFLKLEVTLPLLNISDVNSKFSVFLMIKFLLLD